MFYVRLIFGVLILFSANIYADEMQNTIISESQAIVLPLNSSVSMNQLMKKNVESQKLTAYSGVIGTAPKHFTVSSVGGAFEIAPNNISTYEFFSQTLANDFYYELRLIQRITFDTPNPAIPGLNASDVNNPLGYGVTGIFGYNFHPTDTANITPFIRLQAQKDWSPVYADKKDDHINSVSYVAQLGAKFSFKATPVFAPYITLRGGLTYSEIDGSFPSVKGAQDNDGILNQYVFVYEIGMATKITKSFAVIPYTQSTSTFNYPDEQLNTSIAKGGLGLSNTVGSVQLYGLKLSYNW